MMVLINLASARAKLESPVKKRRACGFGGNLRSHQLLCLLLTTTQYNTNANTGANTNTNTNTNTLVGTSTSALTSCYFSFTPPPPTEHTSEHCICMCKYKYEYKCKYKYKYFGGNYTPLSPAAPPPHQQLLNTPEYTQHICACVFFHLYLWGTVLSFTNIMLPTACL